MIQLPVYRACDLCIHGRAADGQCAPSSSADRVCVCPEVTGRQQATVGVPVATARANFGPCGIEANHLDFAGLRP